LFIADEVQTGLEEPDGFLPASTGASGRHCAVVEVAVRRPCSVGALLTRSGYSTVLIEWTAPWCAARRLGDDLAMAAGLATLEVIMKN
jgi:4-aminobutyrate aminotransferase-like enzyme